MLWKTSLYTLLLLSVFSFSCGLYAAEYTEDFSGSAMSNDACVDEGDAIETIEFTTSSGQGGCMTTNTGANASRGVYMDYFGGTSSYVTISLSTDSAFKFISIYLDDAAGFGASSYQVNGYSGGSVTEGPDTVDVSSANTHAINWNNVDSVRFVAIGNPSDVAAIFDNIVYDDPVGANTAPTVSTNTGSSLAEGATDIITSSELASTDPEEDNTTLIYTITDTVDRGALQNNGSTIALNETFTQANINDSLITYVHDDSNTTSDSFGFKVSDGTDEVTGQTFNITISAVDDDTPTIVTNNTLELNEGATATIPDDSLAATDADTEVIGGDLL